MLNDDPFWALAAAQRPVILRIVSLASTIAIWTISRIAIKNSSKVCIGTLPNENALDIQRPPIIIICRVVLPEFADNNSDNEKYKNSYNCNRYYLICSHPKRHILAL
jgi:hypothetical protein